MSRIVKRKLPEGKKARALRKTPLLGHMSRGLLNTLTVAAAFHFAGKLIFQPNAVPAAITQGDSKSLSESMAANQAIGTPSNPIRISIGQPRTAALEDAGVSEKSTLPYPWLLRPFPDSKISSHFGWRFDPFSPLTWEIHKGIDYAVEKGTPVIAACDGMIKEMGPKKGFGDHYVLLDCGNGIDVEYGHMEAFEGGLAAGMRIQQGQIVGKVGNEGRSTGPHVHFAILVNGERVNPEELDHVAARPAGRRSIRYASMEQGSGTSHGGVIQWGMRLIRSLAL